MKKLIAIAALCAAFLFAAGTTAEAQTKIKTETAKRAKTASVVYTCPMHHDVIACKPGKCPKPGCGMTLVKKEPVKIKV